MSSTTGSGDADAPVMAYAARAGAAGSVGVIPGEDGARPGAGHVAGLSPAATQEFRETVDALLLLERLMITLYYTGLTAPGVMRNAALAGPSGNPNNPGLPPGGNPPQVRYLQAALDAEVKHAAILTGLGAGSPVRHFYFPALTFAHMGSAVSRASFLGALDTLETVLVGAYAAAAVGFARLGRPDLAGTAAEIMGVESEHRTLGRVVGAILPANSHTLETAPFDALAQAIDAVRPFVTGERFLYADGPRRAVAVPTYAQTRWVIGRHGTRLVRKY